MNTNARRKLQGPALNLFLATTLAAAAACSTSESTGTGGSGGRGGSSATTGAGGSSNPTTGAGGSSNPTTGAGGSTNPTTGAGGVVGTTGAGGSGGPVQKACATKITAMNPVILDFENYTGTTAPKDYLTAFGGAAANMGTAYTGPYVYPEDSTSPAPTLALMAGHPPSNWAVAASLSAKVWGMGGGFWMGCVNAAAYKGISFWVRGTVPLGTMSFGVAMENTSLPAADGGGGTCTGTDATCLAAVKKDIPVTADWTHVQIMWADFEPGSSAGTPVAPTGDNITGLTWSTNLQYVLAPGATDPVAGPYVPMPADLSLNIDDVSFIP